MQPPLTQVFGLYFPPPVGFYHFYKLAGFTNIAGLKKSERIKFWSELSPFLREDLVVPSFLEFLEPLQDPPK